VVGIDLYGDETAAPPEQFAQVFQIVQNAGLGLETMREKQQAHRVFGMFFIS
jgi:adenosine deaminase